MLSTSWARGITFTFTVAPDLLLYASTIACMATRGVGSDRPEPSDVALGAVWVGAAPPLQAASSGAAAKAAVAPPTPFKIVRRLNWASSALAGVMRCGAMKSPIEVGGVTLGSGGPGR